MYVAIAVTTIPTLVACFLPATHLTHLEPSTPPRYHLKKRKKWQARRRRRWRCKQKKMRSGDGPRTCSKLQFPYLHVGHPPAAHHLSLPPLLQFFVLLLLVLFLLLRISFLPSFLPCFGSMLSTSFHSQHTTSPQVNLWTTTIKAQKNMTAGSTTFPQTKKKSITNNISRLDRDVGWGQKKFLIRYFLLSFEVKWLFSCGQWLIMRTQVH